MIGSVATSTLGKYYNCDGEVRGMAEDQARMD